MSAVHAFLRFTAKAALNAVGGGIAGDFAVELLPEVASSVWKWWAKDKTCSQLRDELQQVAQMADEEVVRQAEQAVEEEAGSLSPEERADLTIYLSQIPSTIRQSQRRTLDPAGHAVSSDLSLRRSKDLLPLLPATLPLRNKGAGPLLGYRPGTQAGDITATVMEFAGPFTMSELMKKVPSLNRNRVRSHLTDMCKRGLLLNTQRGTFVRPT